jgi:myo-inositol-1(or 4)-monophosphatase
MGRWPMSPRRPSGPGALPITTSPNRTPPQDFCHDRWNFAMTDRDLELRLLTACAVVREAGRLAHDFFVKRAELDVEHKSGVQDLVSIADREVEELIRTRLRGAFPEDGMLGEEGGGDDDLLAGDADLLDGEPDEQTGHGDRDERGLWVIDPIDGTANFLRGMPYWSVAVAYLVGDRTEIGVTYDPVHDDLFWARRGTGAYRNERAIRVSGCDDPGQAVLGSTFTFKMKVEDYVGLIEGMLRAGSDHRRMGSTALMMAHVADGRLDGCATLYCNSWDVIGGLLLVREAGGMASDFLSGATLTEPNRAFGCAPGLQEVIEGLTGLSAAT